MNNEEKKDKIIEVFSLTEEIRKCIINFFKKKHEIEVDITFSSLIYLIVYLSKVCDVDKTIIIEDIIMSFERNKNE